MMTIMTTFLFQSSQSDLWWQESIVINNEDIDYGDDNDDSDEDDDNDDSDDDNVSLSIVAV